LHGVVNFFFLFAIRACLRDSARRDLSAIKRRTLEKRRKNVRPVDIYSNEVVVVVVVVVGESVGRPARRRLLVRKS
jgi:hypothetical protein